MKKLKYITLLIVAITLYSCGEKTPPLNKLIDNDGFYRIKIKAPKNNGSEVVTFSIMQKDVMDSLGVDEKALVNIAKSSISEVKNMAKNPLTFEYSESGTIYYNKDKNNLMSSVRGSAENSYGVKGSISSMCNYDFKGELIECLK